MKQINPKANYDVVCPWEKDLPAEEQTIFHCKVLTLAEEELVDDSLSAMKKGGDINMKLGSQSNLALHVGLMGITNLPDENGKNISMERDNSGKPLIGNTYPWKKSCLLKIEKRARTHVGMAIINGGKVDEEESKNSES